MVRPVWSYQQGPPPKGLQDLENPKQETRGRKEVHLVPPVPVHPEGIHSYCLRIRDRRDIGLQLLVLRRREEIYLREEELADNPLEGGVVQ